MRRCGFVRGVLGALAGLGVAQAGFGALAEFDMELTGGRFFSSVTFNLTGFQSIFADGNTTDLAVGQPDGVEGLAALNPALSGWFSYDTQAPVFLTGQTATFYRGIDLVIEAVDPSSSSGVSIRKSEPLITVNKSTFSDSLSVSSSFEPFTDGLILQNALTPTVTIDLLQDSQFVAEAPDLPALNAFPVRLTHPQFMDIEVASVLLRDNAMTALPDRSLPATIDLAAFPNSVFIIQFTGLMDVALDPSDYDTQADFDLASLWVSDNLETVLLRSTGNYDFASITGGVEVGADPRVPLLPAAITPAGAFVFESVTVTANIPWFFDPVVAIGYDYEVTEGPLVVEVTVMPVGDQTEFLISVPGVFEDQPITAEVPFDLRPWVSEGVSAFAITGIDPSAGLDPTDPTAFVTGLTFAQDGVVSLTMTPITIPEPASLMLAALGVLALSRRKR